MEPTNYYSEKKFCPRCDQYVRYLMSTDSSYCVDCGGKVQLFSKEDRKVFLTTLKPAKPAGRKGRDKRVS